MAVQKPLVLVGGALQEIPAGDTLSTDLVSGTTIKTINSVSILGSGDMVISGGITQIDGGSASSSYVTGQSIDGGTA